jgi:hypothetical protein
MVRMGHTRREGTHLRVISDEHDKIARVAQALRDARCDKDRTDQEARGYDKRLHKVEDVKGNYGKVVSVGKLNNEVILTNNPPLKSLILSDRLGISLRLILLPTEILDGLVVK